MKKVLLASTALVGFAGAAAAEVSLSGYAEIGIFGGDGAGVETQFHNDIVVNINMSGSTDNGLEFGAKVQLDDTNGSAAINGTPTFDDEAVWVSGSFGKVTLGETDGAFDWALSEIYSGSAIFDDHSTHAGAYWYTGLDATYDNQIMRYEYSFGDFAAALSIEMDDTGVGDESIGLGAKWAGAMGGMDVSAGLGFQDNGVNSVWGLSASAAMANGFSVSLGYADLDNTQYFNTSSAIVLGANSGALVDNWWGLGVAYTTGALTVGANYGMFDTSVGDVAGYGLVANYDLGGGAVAMFGYGHSDCDVACGSWTGNGENTWSAGLGLSF